MHIARNMIHDTPVPKRPPHIRQPPPKTSAVVGHDGTQYITPFRLHECAQVAEQHFNTKTLVERFSLKLNNPDANRRPSICRVFGHSKMMRLHFAISLAIDHTTPARWQRYDADD